MKKILFSLLMLCCMTAAWAGTGTGTKDDPYTGEWQASELGPMLEPGVYLDFNCVIKDGQITVRDTRLDKTVAINWPAWAPGNLIGDPKSGSDYYQYGQDNPSANRKRQSFIITNVSPSAQTSTQFTISGYFSGFYRTPDADGFVYVATAKQMEIVLHSNDHAKVRLTDDIYLSDLGADYDDTFCSTFYGTLDGDGHAIKGDHYPDNTTERRNRTYLFTYSEGAIFKNLTFKHIRKNSSVHYNQAIITSKATKGCVFDNITFDNVGTWTNLDNAGTAAGYAASSTFRNITVRNSDATVDQNQAGCVVGHAENCSFTNITVENCESTAADDFDRLDEYGKSGGVVGRSDNCTFNNVKILGSFIKSYSSYVGGIAGYSVNSHYTNCTIDDQSCVHGKANEDRYVGVGGIVGDGTNDKMYNCVNSALIACEGNNAGGIVGVTKNSLIENSLNTGMVVFTKKDEVQGYYNQYKNPNLSDCISKHYNGKEYVVRKTNVETSYAMYFGGIAGCLKSSTISKCANIGSLCDTRHSGGLVGFVSERVSIKDCLSDFYSPSDDGGIFASRNNIDTYVGITNCVNATSKPSYPTNMIENIGTEHLFTSSDDLASDEVCATLGVAWEQNVDVYPYPTPTVTVFYDRDDIDYDFNYYHTTGNVVITRFFNNDGWYSLCLPFSLTAEQTAEKFAQVAEFSTLEDNTYKFTTVDAIEAGKPYIVKVDAYIANPKFTNVTIAPGVTADNSGAFVGVLQPTEVKDGDLAIGSGTTVNPMNAGVIKPFRAYFPQNSTSGAKAMRFTVDDGEATVVQSPIEAEGYKLKAKGTFNLAGQKVNENYRGIVIKNGKKLMRK